MFKVEISGVKELMGQLEKLGVDISAHIAKALNDSGKQVSTKAQGHTPHDTGKLKRSIALIHSATPSNLKAIVDTKSTYGVFVERGARPHFPPVSALAGWAARKLGDASLAYPVARAIAKRGTRSQKFMAPAAEEAKEIVIDNITGAINDLVGGL